MKLTIPEQEILNPGHLACQGCGATMAMRYVLKAVGRNVTLNFPACCWSVIDGPFPYSAVGVPLYHVAFETAAASASGIRAGLDMLGKTDTKVIAWAGDGGTFDIGIQALSGAAERGDDILYICYDNEAYMNTGIQRSSSTPTGAWTTTTPATNPKTSPKKDMIAIMAAHRIPYTATANIAFPEDIIKKVQKALTFKGTKFIQIFATCPTGWKMRPEYAVKVARLAFDTKVFPLYEVEGGDKWKITRKPKGLPVEEYLKLQGRFRHLKTEDVIAIQKEVDKNWARLEKMAEMWG